MSLENAINDFQMEENCHRYLILPSRVSFNAIANKKKKKKRVNKKYAFVLSELAIQPSLNASLMPRAQQQLNESATPGVTSSSSPAAAGTGGSSSAVDATVAAGGSGGNGGGAQLSPVSSGMQIN